MPNSRRNLDIAIERIARDSEGAVRIRRSMANAIVGQLLPDGAVKGGSSLKLRFGESAARFSRNLGTARVSDIESYAEALETALLDGWNGFTGRLVRGCQASPKNIPAHYVMQSWPPVIEVQPGWTEGYATAPEGLSVLDLNEAIAWGKRSDRANRFRRGLNSEKLCRKQREIPEQKYLSKDRRYLKCSSKQSA